MSERNPLARLEAFSDAIFAIAATLLVLEIKVPAVPADAPASDLWKELANLWPSYLAFVLSFGSILVMWVNHHSALRLLTGTSKQFLYANGFLLLMVTFVPFPTAVLARYVDTKFAVVATVSYAANSLLTSIAFLLWAISMKRPVYLLKPEVSQSEISRIERQTRNGTYVYFLSVVLSWWSPALGLTFMGALWLFWVRMSFGVASEA